MSKPIANDKKSAAATQFKPGNPGGPGRPKGSRNKLEEDFLQVVYEDWKANGAAVLAKVRDTEPGTYLRVVSQILPKESKVDVTGIVEHRGLPEISSRVADLLGRRADSDSPPLLPH